MSQNFFSKARWRMDTLWEVLFRLLVAAFHVEGTCIQLVGDDTLAKHRGPKVWGAGLYRDAVRSSRRHPAYAWGLNWIVLAMVVPVRVLGTEHLIALPILARLNAKEARAVRGPRRKGRGAQQKKTTVALMCEMIALAPQQRAQRLRPTAWRTARLTLYGETVERLVYDFTALWYEVRPDAPVRVVCVRDPKGKRDDEFFFATDLRMSVVDILEAYGGRWAIEAVFRECKQYLGLNDPQALTQNAVLRMTPFCLWLNALVKHWFLRQPSSYHYNARFGHENGNDGSDGNDENDGKTWELVCDRGLVA